MVRWALGIVAAAAVLAALALGVTTRSLGLDLIALRQANEELMQDIAQRDERVAALEDEVQRLRNLVDALQSRQTPDVVSVAVSPSPDAGGVVVTERVEIHVAANGPATHVVLLYHPDPLAAAPDAPAGTGGAPGGSAVMPAAGRPAEGVPPSPAYVVDIARGGQDGWVLRWNVPPYAAGTLYVEACNGARCSLAAQPAAVVRSPVAANDADAGSGSGDGGVAGGSATD